MSVAFADNLVAVRSNGVKVIGKTGLRGLVSASFPMRRFNQRIEASAMANCNLLIEGRLGADKEGIARALHDLSPRRNQPFIGLNCAALPADLIHSELFGYERGSFSGAVTNHLGLFRAAEGGTLFLDEITELNAETQDNLANAIQRRAIRPLGASHERQVDVRLIASTSQQPRAALADGRLRRNLYFSLEACVLARPQLRWQRGDVPPQSRHFVAVVTEQKIDTL